MSIFTEEQQKKLKLMHKLEEAGIVSIRDELLRQQAEGAVVARTEAGDPSFDIPDNVKEAMIKALHDNKTHYTAGAGIPELRSAIVEKLVRENSATVIPSQVIVTNGAMNALYVVFQAISKVCSGDKKKVLVPTPTWTETVDNVVAAGLEPVYYKMNPFAEKCIDTKEIESILLIEKNIVAVVINSPHNPTGAIIDGDTMASLAMACRTKDIYLVSDEAYEHIVYEGHEHKSACAFSYNKIISIFSCSKSYAMSGLRVGYLVSKDTDLLRAASKMVRCTINGVNSVAQWGAVSAMTETPALFFETMLQAYTNRRNKLFEACLACSFIEPVLPKGTFYIWCRINDLSSLERLPASSGWLSTLFFLDHGVGSAPGDVFGPDGYGHIRFSFSCDDNHIDLAASRISEL